MTSTNMGEVIFAESTTGKTTALKQHKLLIDQDDVQKVWALGAGVDGWKVVKDPKLMAAFRDASRPLFAKLVQAGNTCLFWDPDLAAQVAKACKLDVTAYVIQEDDDYVNRTLHRFETGEKTKPSDAGMYARETLTNNHQATRRMVDAKFRRIIEIPPGHYLTEYL